MREEDLLKQFGVTSHELDDDAVLVEDETVDDNLYNLYNYNHMMGESKIGGRRLSNTILKLI